MPSHSQFLLYTKPSSFFITGGPLDRAKKFDFLGVSMSGKLFVNFESVHSEGYIVIGQYQIFFFTKFELTTRELNKTCLKSSKSFI